MDEPTNDLDMETLELLEGLLIDYPGTLTLPTEVAPRPIFVRVRISFTA